MITRSPTLSRTWVEPRRLPDLLDCLLGDSLLDGGRVNESLRSRPGCWPSSYRLRARQWWRCRGCRCADVVSPPGRGRRRHLHDDRLALQRRRLPRGQRVDPHRVADRGGSRVAEHPSVGEPDERRLRGRHHAELLGGHRQVLRVAQLVELQVERLLLGGEHVHPVLQGGGLERGLLHAGVEHQQADDAGGEHRDHEHGERRARGLGATERATGRHHREAGALDGCLGEARNPRPGSVLSGLIKVLMLRCLPCWC